MNGDFLGSAVRLLGDLWFGNPLLGEAWLGAEWGKEWAGWTGVEGSGDSEEFVTTSSSESSTLNCGGGDRSIN